MFVHIPKTGGTSVGHALHSAGARRSLHYPGTLGYSLCTPQHMHAEVYSKLLPAEFYDYGFAVVRHPLFRIFSEYRYLRDTYGLEREFDDWVNDSLDRSEKSSYVLDNHIRPQVDFIAPSIDVFRNEDGLEHPIRRAAAVLGLENVDMAVRKLVASQIKIKVRRRTLDRLLQFYEADFDAFGYSLDERPPEMTIRWL